MFEKTFIYIVVIVVVFSITNISHISKLNILEHKNQFSHSNIHYDKLTIKVYKYIFDLACSK